MRRLFQSIKTVVSVQWPAASKERVGTAPSAVRRIEDPPGFTAVKRTTAPIQWHPNSFSLLCVLSLRTTSSSPRLRRPSTIVGGAFARKLLVPRLLLVAG